MIERGPHLGMPHTKALGDGLFELRVKTKEGIVRVFYCVQLKQEIVMLHSFIKKTQQTPDKELKLAINQLQEVKKMAKRSIKLHDQLKKEVLADPVARAEYEAFKLQLKVAGSLKDARKKAHFTQDDVAECMNTRKTVVARLEAAGGRGKHSPSLKTLVKYANAVGCDVNVKLVPKRKKG